MENENSKKSSEKGVHVSQEQLTLVSIVIGILIIVIAFQYGSKDKVEGTAIAKPTVVYPAQQEAVIQGNNHPSIVDASPKTEPAVTTQLSLPEIKKEWAPRVVQIVCYDNSYVASGSGVLTSIRYANSGETLPTLVTNRHVVMDPTTGAAYDGCSFQTTSSNQIIPLILTNGSYSSVYDVAYFPSYGKNPPPISKTGMKVCSPDDAEVGDSIAILGYPSNGGTGDSSRAITLTTGIVSSFDGEYYVTDAKIDHGNSGGVAVLIKKDCYLGIPTWVQSGGFESLGRILSAKDILVP